MSKYLFVFEDGPGDIEEGLIPLVKLADGTSTKINEFDFAANVKAWQESHPNLGVWFYLYANDTPQAIADIVKENLVKPTIIVLDIEETIGANVVSPLVKLLHDEGHTVWLSTFGLIGQAQTRQIPFMGMGFDVFSPQVYYPYQADGPSQWSGHGANVIPTYSPGDWPGLQLPDDEYALWRYPLVGKASGGSNVSEPPTVPVSTPVANTPTQSKEINVTSIPLVKEGAGANGRNQIVANVQGILDAHGYHLNIDGNFGPLTNSALREFQGKAGIAVDGIVGPDTWNKLLTA